MWGCRGVRGPGRLWCREMWCGGVTVLGCGGWYRGVWYEGVGVQGVLGAMAWGAAVEGLGGMAQGAEGSGGVRGWGGSGGTGWMRGAIGPSAAPRHRPRPPAAQAPPTQHKPRPQGERATPTLRAGHAPRSSHEAPPLCAQGPAPGGTSRCLACPSHAPWRKPRPRRPVRRGPVTSAPRAVSASRSWRHRP